MPSPRKPRVSTPDTRDIAAFRAGYELLAKVQKADPDALAWLFGLPHIGAWAHDCLEARTGDCRPISAISLRPRRRRPYGLVSGSRLDVPVRDGRILLPGLGYFHGIDQDSWVRLRSDGERLTVGTLTEAPCAAPGPG